MKNMSLNFLFALSISMLGTLAVAADYELINNPTGCAPKGRVCYKPNRVGKPALGSTCTPDLNSKIQSGENCTQAFTLMCCEKPGSSGGGNCTQAFTWFQKIGSKCDPAKDANGDTSVGPCSCKYHNNGCAPEGYEALTPNSICKSLSK